MGESKTLMNAQQLYHWPDMTNNIKRLSSTCTECILYLLLQLLGPQIQATATLPFESVSIDFGTQKGIHYLIFVNRFIYLYSGSSYNVNFEPPNN